MCWGGRRRRKRGGGERSSPNGVAPVTISIAIIGAGGENIACGELCGAAKAPELPMEPGPQGVLPNLGTIYAWTKIRIADDYNPREIVHVGGCSTSVLETDTLAQAALDGRSAPPYATW